MTTKAYVASMTSSVSTMAARLSSTTHAMDAPAYTVPATPMTRYDGTSSTSSAVTTTVQNSRCANSSSIWMTSVRKPSEAPVGFAWMATTNRPTRMSSSAGWKRMGSAVSAMRASAP